LNAAAPPLTVHAVPDPAVRKKGLLAGMFTPPSQMSWPAAKPAGFDVDVVRLLLAARPLYDAVKVELILSAVTVSVFPEIDAVTDDCVNGFAGWKLPADIASLGIVKLELRV
jgi:hypothetical protein